MEWHAGLARGHVAQYEQTMLVPTIAPCQDGGQDDDDESVWHVRDSGKARLKTFLDLPELLREQRFRLVHNARRTRGGGGGSREHYPPADHDDRERRYRDDGGQSVSMASLGDQEGNLGHAAAVHDAPDLARARAEPELWDQLIHEDHETDGADETTQERPAQDVVQEAQARDAGDQEEAAGQARHDTGRAGVVVVVVVAELAGLDVGSNDGAEQHRPGRLGSDDHLRTAPEESVDQGIDDVRVQTVDGRDVREVLGEGQGHGQVEGCHGEGRYDVAAQPRPAILLDPGQQRQIVARVRGLAASAAGRPSRPRPHPVPEDARREIHDRVSQDPAHDAIAPSSTAACVMQPAKAHAKDVLVLDSVRCVQRSRRARRRSWRECAMVAGSGVCGLVVPGLSF